MKKLLTLTLALLAIAVVAQINVPGNPQPQPPRNRTCKQCGELKRVGRDIGEGGLCYSCNRANWEERQRQLEEERRQDSIEIAEMRRRQQERQRRQEERKRNACNKLLGDMVHIDGGTFVMGNEWNSYNHARNDEWPERRVTLSSFSLCRYEVTQELWEVIMGKNPSAIKGDNMPINSVSWVECQEFIAKLNDYMGARFRMPTEAEWEWAARGGYRSRGTLYAGSSNPLDVAWIDTNAGEPVGVNNANYGIHRVGQKQPNELGLYDMSGNVSEWCSDWYGKYVEGSVTNPQGPATGTERVSRGGNWYNNANWVRVTARRASAPEYKSQTIGLRLAL